MLHVWNYLINGPLWFRKQSLQLETINNKSKLIYNSTMYVYIKHRYYLKLTSLWSNVLYSAYSSIKCLRRTSKPLQRSLCICKRYSAEPSLSATPGILFKFFYLRFFWCWNNLFIQTAPTTGFYRNYATILTCLNYFTFY